MEGYLRLGLLFIAGIILFLILLESWIRRRRFKLAKLPVNDSVSRREEPTAYSEPVCSMKFPVTDQVIDTLPDFLSVSVFAKPNTVFASYDLLQAITSTGMQYGEMNIFHYYLKTDQGRIALFSLASATKPGDFNLDRMGEFSCIGLTLFMNRKAVPHPSDVFEMMLATAEQLAEDLEGDLYAEPQKPLTQNKIEQYRLIIRKGASFESAH